MKKKFTKVLVVDDNEDVLLAARLLLKQQVNVVVTEKNPEMIPELLNNDNYDVIFLDMNFTKDMTSGQEGFFWLKKIIEIDPLAVVILITAYGDVESAVHAVKAGATDFILKPWQNEKLIATLHAALTLRESRIEIDNLKSREEHLTADINKGFQEIIGISPGMQSVFNTVKKVAGTDANVLILGENGTGKELVARALHRESKRAGRAFIKVDLGAITSTLFESELFGHVKGAFTDARDDRAGRFEIASGGTIFLDEIGNLSLELQSKLLTVLQNRQVARVGSNKYKEIDIRLICATNTQLRKLVSEKQFRQDLLYRINTVEIQIPPLRERVEDIPLLAEYFLSNYKNKYNKPDLRFDPLTLRKLENYDWPGNIRELQHSIERSIILSETNVLQPSDVLLRPLEEEDGQKIKFDNYNLNDVEKTIIQKVLRENGGNISRAAQELGLTRTSLYRRMQKHGL